MTTRHVRTASLLLLAGAMLACPLRAHGPQFPPPGDNPGNPRSRFGGNPGGNPNPNPAPAPAPAFGGITSGGSAPTRGGLTGRVKRVSSYESAVGWDWWWGLNKERYLQVKTSLLHSEGITPTQRVSPKDDPAAARQAYAKRLRSHIIPFLRRGLADRDAAVRAESVLALAKVGRPGTLDDIRRLLRDDVLAVREAAVLALGLIDDAAAVETLTAIVDDSAAGRRAVAETSHVPTRLRMLATVGLGLAGNHGGTGGREGAAVLVRSLQARHANTDLNIAAALALGVMRAREAVPTLIDLVASGDGDPYVRANAAGALGRIGDRRALPVLVAALGDGHLQVKRSAAMALGGLAGPADESAVKALMTAARSGSDRARSNFAILALGEIGGDDARNFLFRMVKKASSRFERSYAAVALGVWGFENEDPFEAEVCTMLRGELARLKSPRTRGAFAIALGLLGDAKAADQLAALVDDGGDAKLRAHACTALGLIRAKSGVPALRRATEDKTSPALRVAAAVALGLVGDGEATKVLDELVEKDSGLALVGAAIRGLGLIGDRRVALQLGRWLTDPALGQSDAKRAYAASALGLLGDKDDVPALARLGEEINFTAGRGVLHGLFAKL